jgi:hypothetical protein
MRSADQAADDDSPLATHMPTGKASSEDWPDATVIVAASCGGRPATDGRSRVSCLACATAACRGGVSGCPASL